MSSLTTLARPYAKAAFDLARGRQSLGDWGAWLQTASQVVAEAAVANWLTSPTLDRSQPVQLIADAAQVAVDSHFGRFLGVLAENDRLGLLPEITLLFNRLREGAEGRLKVRVVSAIPLQSDQAERMSAALQKRFECEVELENEVDAGVLGGAIIYAGDQVIDGSLKGRLDRLQNSLA
jgi:F-type H+-transporting ATPase subunit delta